MTTAIEVRDLRKTYGDNAAIDGIDLEIREGEVFALLGPNGAGKSTTVEILEGFRERTGGEVSVLGHDPAKPTREWRERLGVMLQTTSEQLALTPRESITHMGRLYSSPRDTDELLVAVGLDEKADAKPRTLSGGMRRRLDVALAVVGSPELVFLDEPTTGFDPEARRQFWGLIESLRQGGTTIVLTTHYLDEAEHLADRIAIIAEGRVAALDTPAGLRARATDSVVTWRENGETASGRDPHAHRNLARTARGTRRRGGGTQRHQTVARGRLLPDHWGREVKQPSWTFLARDRITVELKEFFRSREQMIFIFFFPVMLLVLFGSIFGGQDVEKGVTFGQYFLAGMIASGIMNTGFQSLALGIATDRDTDVLKRLHGTPLPPTAFFAGKFAQVLVVSIVQIAMLIVVGVLFYGVNLPTSASVWGTFVWVFVLGTAASVALGMGMSSLLRNARAGSAILTPVVLFLQFISGVFIIFTEVPPFLQHVASIFPLKWLAQGMRSVFLPESFESAEASGSWQHGATAIVLIVWTIVGTVWAVRSFRWQRPEDR